jgi:RNA polymerase sigma-70 factor, ECF subfamily
MASGSEDPQQVGQLAAAPTPDDSLRNVAVNPVAEIGSMERPASWRRLVGVHASLLSSPTDHDLVQLARAGDAQALEHLLGRLADELLPLASALSVGSNDADALLGDTLSRVYERLHQLQRADAVLAWARRLMVRQFLDRRRWQQRRREVQLETGEHESSLVTTAEVLDLRSELAALARPDRALVVLRYWQGYTYEECAALLQLPVGTVKSRLSRLLGKLRVSLGGDHHDTH